MSAIKLLIKISMSGFYPKKSGDRRSSSIGSDREPPHVIQQPAQQPRVIQQPAQQPRVIQQPAQQPQLVVSTPVVYMAGEHGVSAARSIRGVQPERREI